MNHEPSWISEAVALAIHHRQIAEHGGAEGVRDLGLLQSALGKPQSVFQYTENPSLARLAASYAYGIARNHPFLDGNKRTAFVVCRLFLIKNGYDIVATHEEKYLTFLRLAEGSLSEDSLEAWLASKLKKIG